MLLYRAPLGFGRGLPEGQSRPLADVHFEQTALDAHGHVPGLGDDARRLARALERRGVDGHYFLDLGDAGGRGLGLLAALLGEVQAARAAGQLHAGRGSEAVAHQKDDGGGWGFLVFHREIRNALSPCSLPLQWRGFFSLPLPPRRRGLG